MNIWVCMIGIIFLFAGAGTVETDIQPNSFLVGVVIMVVGLGLLFFSVSELWTIRGIKCFVADIKGYFC